VQEIEEFITLLIGFLGRRIQIWHIKIHGCQGGCHDNLKHSNRHNFISVQDIDTNFAYIVGFSGSAISNMLSKISKEPRKLKWQPNIGKNEPKMNKTSCLDRIVRRRNVVNGSEDVFLGILVQKIEKFIARTVGISGLVIRREVTKFQK